MAAALAAGPVQAQDAEAQRWYLQGVEALRQGRYDEARKDLREAVRADPALAGAWLDLAIATRAAGDAVQAEEFLAILESRFALPERIAQGVAALRQQIDADRRVAHGGWTWTRSVQAGAGYDTNANAGLAVSDLTLTFPGGGLTLPLAIALLPRGSTYGLASAAATGRRAAGTLEIEASGSLKLRHNTAARDFDTQELQAALALQSDRPAWDGPWAALFPGPWRAAINVQATRLGGQMLFNSLGFTAQHAWTGRACSLQAGLELDVRNFPVAPNLDSRLAWANASASCPAAGGTWTGQIRVGLEQARNGPGSDHARPGADTRHAEFALVRSWAWAGAGGEHRVDLLLQWAQAADTAGYNPLLANGAARRVDRGTLGAAWTRPLPAPLDGWTGTLTLQGFRQDSNLGLFRLAGKAGQFSMQRSW